MTALKRKKICFYVSDISEFGGIGRVTRIMAKQLASCSDVFIVTLNCVNEVRLSFLASPLRTQYDYPVHLSSVFFHCIRDVHTFLRQNNIEFLVSGNEMLSPVCRLAAIGTGAKVICWFHSNADVYNEYRFQRFCRFFAAKTSNVIVTLTPYMTDIVSSRYKPARVCCIPNPIDPVLLKEIRYNETSKRIISVGRLCYAKNFEQLVRIAAIVLKAYPDWSWDIFGEGSHRETIENLIVEFGLEDRLRLCGAVKEIYSIYPNYAFQVMTSRYEGFPMTLLEGMSCGLPLVSFDVIAGPRMIIKNNVNGFLVPPGDIETMVERITELICNRDLRKNFSKENSVIRHEFDVAKTADKWLEMFNVLV